MKRPRTLPLLSAAIMALLLAPSLLAQTADLDNDGDVDRDDILIILSMRNQPAGVDDPRDLNDDGVIDILDARLAVVQCDRDNCATEDQQPPEIDLNGPPPEVGDGFAATFTENGGPLSAADSDATVTDMDMGDLVSGTVTIRTLFDGADEVLAADATGTSIVASYNPGSGVLTLTGPDSVANFQQVIRTVTYDNTSDDPDTTTRNIDFQVQGPAAGEVSNTATTEVTVIAANDGPVVDLNGPAMGLDFAAVFNEDGGPVSIVDAAATVDDPDTAMVASATVTISNLLDGTDEVLAADTAGTSIVANYTPATGILSLTGPDTPANFQTVIRTVTYDNTSMSPNTTNRAVAFQANDGLTDGPSATSDLTIAGDNDPPTISDIADFMVAEDAATVNVPFTVDDPDHAAADLTVMVTGNTNPGLVSVILGGSGTNRTAMVMPQLNQNGMATITITVEDPLMAMAGDSFTVTVTAMPDDPVLANGGSLGYTEDDPPTAVSPSLTVSEFDGENITGATVVISPGTFQSGQDVLDCTPAGSVTCSFAAGTLTLTGTDTAAVYQTVLQSVTYENTDTGDPVEGQRDLTYQVTDASAADSNMLAATVTVTAVNDPPMAQADAYTTVGNTQIAGGTIDATLTPFQGPAFAADADGVLTQGTPDSDVDSATLTVSRAGADSGSLADIGPGDPIATMGGGTVRFDEDGTFLYTPPAGAKNTADSFVYEVCDDEVPAACSEGAVDVTIVDERIIYVDNSAAAGGDGTSGTPFNQLNDGVDDTPDDDAQEASVDGDTILIFEGDGADTGQDQGIELKNGQILLGHSSASFMLGGVTIMAPNPPATTVSPPSDFPVVSNSAGNGVTVDATAADRVGVEVRGLDLSGSANAVDVTSGGTFAVSVVIDGNFINASAAEGIDLNPAGSGSFTATVSNNAYATASPSGNGFDLTTGAGTDNAVVLDFSG
ncbi:MAG TPA: Ig-like domain-containing protein, partial [Acidobacteriota bacterium]|nr:Ig-like domain-containing protein [Acidobacteriota bacterium]